MAIGMVMHDFHGLTTMTFHYVADNAYLSLAVIEIIHFFSLNLTSETCSKNTGQNWNNPRLLNFQNVKS